MDIYQLEILDSNMCFYEVFIEVTEPDADNKYISCRRIYWLSSSRLQEIQNIFEMELKIENIASGTYSVEVFDTKGCIDSLTIDIPFVDPIEITFEKTNLTCIDQVDGTKRQMSREVMEDTITCGMTIPI